MRQSYEGVTRLCKGEMSVVLGYRIGLTNSRRLSSPLVEGLLTWKGDFHGNYRWAGSDQYPAPVFS